MKEKFRLKQMNERLDDDLVVLARTYSGDSLFGDEDGASGEAGDDGEQFCSICQMEFNDTPTQKVMCGHIFHYKCIVLYCQSHVAEYGDARDCECPNCQQP